LLILLLQLKLFNPKMMFFSVIFTIYRYIFFLKYKNQINFIFYILYFFKWYLPVAVIEDWQ
jgi:hypothetical protein